MTIACTLGSALMPPARSDSEQILASPSGTHPLGTDLAGRDNALLLVHGGADMLLLATIAGVAISAIAVLVGVLGASIGGSVDRASVWITDVWLTVPRFILLLVIASLVQIRSTLALGLLIAAFSWPYLARQVRSQTLALRDREHVEAARMLALGRLHTLLRYLLPALAPFLVISTIQGMTQAIYQEVVLAFFGE